LAQRHGARLVIINLEPTHLDHLASAILHADAADILPEVVHRLET
jgi:NAD-dependent SIR2 family protein deacetylase